MAINPAKISELAVPRQEPCRLLFRCVDFLRNPGNETVESSLGLAKIRAVIRFHNMRDACGLLLCFILRGVERVFSVESFCRLLKPFAFARAAFNTIFKKRRPDMLLPACFGVGMPMLTGRQWRMNAYLNHVPDFFPDRLATDKWKGRCRIEGIGHLRLARQNGRPVILAFCHFGPYYLLRSWLRAAGFPTAFLVGGKARHRSALRRFKDRLSIFPEIPVAFHRDTLRNTAEFLAAGNPLLVAIDNEAGKQSEVPFCDGWTFQMAAGAVRLAVRHQAELIPCTIIDEGRWRFRIELGRPVPKEFLTAEAGWICAGKHLLDEMIPHFQAHPEQHTIDLIRRLKRNSSTAAT